MNERVYRTIARQTIARGPVGEAVLRFALALWVRDAASGLTAAQVSWLRLRALDYNPFTPHEHAKLVPQLLAWSAGKDARHMAALVQGLRGVVDEALLPEAKE